MTVPETDAPYPLTPLQEGMLLHSLLASGSGVDIEQLLCDFDHGPAAEPLRRSWQGAMSRYPVLRTEFRWESVDHPIQMIRSEAPLAWEELDWRGQPADVQANTLEAFLTEDRRRGFDLAHAPLMRVTLIRRAEAQWTLAWTFHHILLDGRSFPMILEEVFDAAAALGADRQPTFQHREPFRRYVEWSRLANLATEEAWWRSNLAGYQGEMRLPGVRRELSTRDGPTTAEACRVLGPETTARLARVAAELDATVATLVQTAWAVVVCRYSATTDLVFGATLSMRRASVPGADQMAGLLINTVPFRVRIDPLDSVADTVRDVRRRWAALREHRQTPLRLAQNWSGLPPGQPLFDTLLVYEHDLLADRMQALGGAWARRRISLREQTNYAITAAVYGGSALTIKLEFDPGRVNPAQVERMAGHFGQVLRAIAENPSGRIDDLVLQPSGERDEISGPWRGRRTTYDREATVHGRFGLAVRDRPDASALVWNHGSLTYSDLDRRSNRLARVLQSRGAGPGRFVAVCLDRSPAQVVTILAILKTGAAYVPLDPAYPADRLRFMVDDTDPPVVVTESRYAERLPVGTPDRLLIVDDEGPASPESADPLAPIGQPDAPAYVMYTSGSTGRPKGVVVPHRAILRLVLGNDFIEFGPDQTFLAVAPASFDASTLELWGALLHGGRLALFTGAHPTAELLGASIRQHGVTTLWLTAALFQQVVDTDIEVLRPVRQLLAGGDVLPVPHVRRVIETLPGTRLVNGYGPTENTTFTCCHTITAADLDGPSIPIGRSIANTTVAIIDDRDRPVPVGVEGELVTGGDGLALGYLNRPDLTAERFVGDPLEPGGRVYRTGDRARWRPDGTIEFLGRRDLQVKLRGFRIELGEIESVLARHPNVREAVVLCREDVPGTKRLVGYVTSKAGALTPEALRSFLQPRLPEYMIPTAFVGLESFPINANGKIDRRVLPAPTSGSSDRAFAAPTTEAERRLAAIWCDVLRLGTVGIDDSFFELGGDSILAIQVTARARQADVPISAAQLMAHPTIRELAQLAHASLPTAAGSELDGTGPVPLTPIQSWFFEQNLADWHHWNQAFLFEAACGIDAAALEAAVARVVSHHDVFRLQFRALNGAGSQTLGGDAPTPRVEVFDLSATDNDEFANAIEAITGRMAASLDPVSGRLIAVALIRGGVGRKDRVSVTVHHLIVDGVSWRILREDLESSYHQVISGAVAPLPAVTTTFAGWARTLAATGSGADQVEQQWWHEAMATPADIPCDGPRSGGRTEGEADVVTVTLGEAETGALLQQVPAAFNTQINDVLLAALSLGLGPWAGREQLRIDLEGHGRETIAGSRDPSRVVGWFTSVFPFVVPTGRASDPLRRLKEVKERLRQLPRRGVGFGLLHYLERSAATNGADAEFVFNYLGQFDQVISGSSLFRFAKESAGPWHAAAAPRRHLIEVIGIVIEGRLELRWSFSPAIHRRATVEALAAAVVDALRDLIHRCTAPEAGGRTPSDYPLVQLTQPQVDLIAGRGREIEDVAPLAPMQAMFLATAGSGNDVGWSRWTYRLTGLIDQPAFAAAWQVVVARHQILRTAFVSDGLDAPVQVIHRTAVLEIETLDWRGVPEGERARRRAQIPPAPALANPGRPPLMRVSLTRVGERDWICDWAHHHLLLDRWSWPLLLNDVAIAYDALRSGGTPTWGPAPAWRRYLGWLAGQDRLAAEQYWEEALRGLGAAGQVGRASSATGPDGEVRTTIGGADRDAIVRTARSQSVTVNTLITTAWLLWLHQETGRGDVACGMTVTGRPDEVPGIATMVGMCINNVPLRIGVKAGERSGDLLRRVQQIQVEALPHHWVSPIRLQELSGLGWSRRLYETLVVFQHAAADETATRWLGSSVAIEPDPVRTTTSYPITLVVSGDSELTLTLTFQGRHLDESTAALILERLGTILRRLTMNPEPSAEEALMPLSGTLLGADGDLTNRPYEAPETATEWVVAQIWSGLLGRERIGRSDNFFDLGGQSLAATQLGARVRQALRVEVPIASIFEHPTVADYAAVLAGRGPGGQVERVATIVRQVEEMTEQDFRKVAPGV